MTMSGLGSFATGAGRDLRFAIRMAWRSPLVTLGASATLALAIGANTAIFTVVKALWLRPVAVSRPEALAVVYERIERPGQPSHLSDLFHPGDADRLTSLVPAFDGVAAELVATGLMGEYRPRVSFGPDDTPLEAVAVSHQYFRVLGVSVRGRAFRPDDDRPGALPVVVLGHEFWQARLAGDPSVVGREIALGRTQALVIGVAAPSFRGAVIGDRVDLWLPLGALPSFLPVTAKAPDLAQDALAMAPVRLYGRLRDGRAQAEQQVSAALARPVVLRTLAEIAYPARVQAAATSDARLLWLLLATAGFVLVMGCLNLTSLLVARAERRRHEIAVRLSLGISRPRLVGLLLSDAAVLIALGAAGALVVSRWFLETLSAFALPTGIPVARLNVDVDWRVVTFAVAVSMGTVLLAGLAPAWHSARPSLATLLNTSGGTGRRGSHRRRFVLLAGHVAISLVLLVCAALFVRSVRRAFERDLGFAADRVLAVVVQPSLTQYLIGDGDLDFMRRQADAIRLIDRLRALPGVTAVTTGVSPLLQPAHQMETGAAVTDLGTTQVRLVTLGAGPGYLGATGVPLRAGRDLTPDDVSPGAPPVALVSESLARALWPGTSAIGHRLSFGRSRDVEIVGVTGDAVRAGARGDAQLALYVPEPLRPDRPMLGLVVGTAVDAGTIAPAVLDSVRRVFPDATQVRQTTARQEIEQEMASERLGASLFSWFGAMALALAVLGVYGLVAFITVERTREFGIRLALGASPAGLLRTVVGRGLAPVAAGCAAGLAGAAVVSGALRAYLFDLSPFDPVAFGGGAVLIGLLAAAAGLTAARRILRLDPVAVLREQ